MLALHLEPLGKDPPAMKIEVDHFPFILGRDCECDELIPHPLVSRRHCRFFLQDSEIWIQDLNSLNGTELNSELLEKPQPLKDGDEIGLPLARYRVVISALVA